MGVGTSKVSIDGDKDGVAEEILTPEALDLLARLHGSFHDRRCNLLEARGARKQAFRSGERPGFLAETEPIRNGAWTTVPAPVDLQDRRVEITGPTSAKMMINALNCGAKVFMADLEDANTPDWSNMLEGQANITRAYERTLSFESPDGKRYDLAEEIATLIVRPRGLHLEEARCSVAGEPLAASFFDIGLYVFRNARLAMEWGSGPYLYLPKLESHLEARFYNDLLRECEDALGLERGTIRVTVLIETVLAALEIEEILYELRERITGLNAGRWDYIFSAIKQFGHEPSAVLPDRAQVTMTVPFMFDYSELLVKLCHKRGVHAIGGMSAFIPNRRKPDVTAAAIAKVRDDKMREASQGFDGSWVAHPDLVPIATECFDMVLGDRPNQLDRQRDDADIDAGQLTTFKVRDGAITEEGIRGNVTVALLYLDSWLRGTGAVAINDLMEDLATAEISRSQLWQWRRHKVEVDGLGVIDTVTTERILDEELEKAREIGGDRLDDASLILRRVVLSEDFIDFLPEAAESITNKGS